MKYFSELHRAVKTHLTVRVIRAPRQGATPKDVVNLAAELQNSSEPTEANDSVWALIDLEAEPGKQAKARSAQKSATKKGVKVALSNPCYEIWTLAHLADTGEFFKDCSEVLTRVRSEWKKAFGTDFGNKGNADYSRLMPLRRQAVACARKRIAATNQSWTEVFKVVEAIDSRRPGNGEGAAVRKAVGVS